MIGRNRREAKDENWGPCQPYRPAHIGHPLLRKRRTSSGSSPFRWPAALSRRCGLPRAADPFCQQHGLYARRDQTLPQRPAGEHAGGTSLEKTSSSEDQRGGGGRRTIAPAEIAAATPAALPLRIAAGVCGAPQPALQVKQTQRQRVVDKRANGPRLLPLLSLAGFRPWRDIL